MKLELMSEKSLIDLYNEADKVGNLEIKKYVSIELFQRTSDNNVISFIEEAKQKKLSKTFDK